MNDRRNIVAKLGEVGKATLDIKEDIKSDSDNMKAVIESSNKILPALNKISENVSSLLEHMDTPKAQAEPSVRPKEKKKNYVEKDVTDDQEVLILEPKRRKGLFFSSSIGLQCDVQQLSNDINSRIAVTPTYHIDKHEDAKDPELFLKKNLDTLDETTGVNFIIISVGSNDITRLNIEDDIRVLNDKACEQSKNLALLAEETSKKHNIDVFVVEKPARFDREAKDPEGIRSVLTVSSNGILPSLITPLKRVHFIPLPSLTSKADRDCFSRDGVHLTSKGQSLFHLDLVAGVKSVFSDLNLETFTHPKTKNFQRDGKYVNDRSEEIRSTEDSNKTSNSKYHKKHTGGNSRQDVWNDNRDIPRG